MKLFFLHFFELSSHSGISKKIIYQTTALKKLGVDVELCHLKIYDNGKQCRVCGYVDIDELGRGWIVRYTKWFKYKKLTDYIIEAGIDVVYIRSFYNTTPQLLKMFKNLKIRGIKIVLEFPTYPYDSEVRGGALKTRMIFLVNRLFRSKLKKYVDRAVTFSLFDFIHGIPTIKISNGIDFSAVPLKRVTDSTKEIVLLGVADIHIWHGFDRVILGLKDYYRNASMGTRVVFNIVGDGDTFEIERLKQLTINLGLSEFVHFSGYLYGKMLDEEFNKAHFGIASLARHRTNITSIKTLKNREYAARGIPFLYSERDDDFDGMPYIIKALADDSAIEILTIVNFLNHFNMTPDDIRNSIINNLSWDIQMKKVLDNI